VLIGCLLVVRLHDNPRSWRTLLALIIVGSLIGLLKQTSIAVFMGLAVFAVLNPVFSIRSKLLVLVALLASGVVILAVMLPNAAAMTATVEVMSDHPTDLSPKALVMQFWDVVNGFWWLLIPVALVIFQSRTKGSHTNLTAIWCLVAVAIPLSLFQLLSSVKAGGDFYNHFLGMAMLAPIAALGLQRLASGRQHNLIIVLVVSATIIANFGTLSGTVAYSREEWREYREVKNYLEAEHSGAVAVYPAYWYRVVKDAGIEPRTDWHTLGHYRGAGIYFDHVLADFKNTKYDLIIGPIGDLSDRYNVVIAENYRLESGPHIPPSLTNAIWVPIRSTQ
jgi:hypothetical protein